MPLYEGIGLISEKHAVVLEIGTSYTKCGYAGDGKHILWIIEFRKVCQPEFR